MFNWGIRHPIATRRVRISGKYGSSSDFGEETFVNGYWEEGSSDLYSNLQALPGLNPGQQAILEQNQETILSFLFEQGEGYDPDDFLSFLNVELGEAKFNALSETFELYSEGLEEIWDHSYGGDSYGRKKFLGMEFD